MMKNNNKLDSVVGRGKNIEDIYPLTPMQEGMLFHSLYAPNSEQYFEQFRWTMRGQLNKLALKGSWEQVMHRHATLHSGFVWETFSSPHQVVLQKVMLPWKEFDWSVEFYDSVVDGDDDDDNNDDNNKYNTNTNNENENSIFINVMTKQGNRIEEFL